jgi:hypothetical protein
MFIFNLNVVFAMNFLKLGLIRLRFSPGFQEQDFPKSNLLQHGSRTCSRTPDKLLRFSELALAWLSFLRKHLKIREKMFSGKSCSKVNTEKRSVAALAWFYSNYGSSI